MMYYQERLMKMLTEPLILGSRSDTRSRFRKVMDRIRYRTIGRFREWLHRDCGDY